MNLDVVPSPLPPDLAAEVAALVGAATEYDGIAPLNERGILHLTGSHPGDRHVLARRDGRLSGYAQLAADHSAELVTAPAARRGGVGSALVRTLLEAAGEGLRIWAHGRVPGADAFAERLGLAVVRELFRMQRQARTAPALPEVRLPAGIGVRTFRPAVDDAAWLALNARAFAGHPEQGRWGPDDLAERLAQPWFDPAGFFLAEDVETGDLAGFHWTKVHPGDQPVGEVYVVGIDPAYQGSGLGKALTVVGVRHLEGLGLRTVELYVDGANAAARTMYERLGFRVLDVDVQYAPAAG